MEGVKGGKKVTGPPPGIFNRLRNRGGFTLIELLIVIAIIGILATIAVPVFLGQRTKAMRTEAMTNLESIRLLQEQYYAEVGEYAADRGTCAADNNNIAVIQEELPGFKPGDGAALYFSYCIEQDIDYAGNDTTAVGSPYDCFRAWAYGNSAYAPISGMELRVDCNNEKNY